MLNKERKEPMTASSKHTSISIILITIVLLFLCKAATASSADSSLDDGELAAQHSNTRAPDLENQLATLSTMKDIGPIESHTLPGKCSQWIYQCFLESTYPCARCIVYPIAFLGFIALTVSACLSAADATSLIENSEALNWTNFSCIIVAAISKTLVMMMMISVQHMKDYSEKNYRAMIANPSIIRQAAEDIRQNNK
jgi:flagellar basal body-associated protein FliL